MKKITLSAALIAALSSFAIAGGDIAPVEPVVEEPMVEESTGAFYLGLAYSYMSAQATANQSAAIPVNGGFLTITDSQTIIDDSVSSVMLQAGYKFNDYVAIEGRYWAGGTTDRVLVSPFVEADVDIDAWGLYVKPMYPVTEAFNIYALLGYASSTYDAQFYSGSVSGSFNNGVDYDGFSWGIGAEYEFNESWALFVDYTVLYDDSSDNLVNGVAYREDVTLDTWNFGVTYSF